MRFMAASVAGSGGGGRVAIQATMPKPSRPSAVKVKKAKRRIIACA